MLSKKSFDFSDDMTALGLLKKAGLSVNTDSNGTYVTSIGGLAQFDHGSESGWMYRVNGTFGSVSAASYSLKANDFVEFLYTRDLGKDIGGYVEEKKDTTSSLSEEDKETLENVLAKVVQNIKTKMTLSDFEYLLLGLYDGSFLKEADFVARVKEANGSYSKATDLERTILAVRAAGLNPANVEGINLLESLVNFSDIEKQGANGAIFALLAYDATGLKLPKTDALSRTVLKEKILSYQKTDGGFALSKIGDSDVDITAMALTALAPYQKESAVKSAVAKAVSYLEKQQQTDGGFLSYSVASSESTSQVIIALASLGIDPADTRFVKNKTTLLTNLYSFKKSDGTFAHIKGKESDEMATYQAGLALLAYQRFLDKGKNLFDMSGKTLVSYNDLSKVSSWATDSVKACKQAFLMSGDANNNFNPTDTLKRSETAKIMVELLKLPKTETKIAFSDVSDAAWYRPYVDTAADAGIVNGIGNYKFDPNGEITRQDFAVMIVRAVGIEKTDTTMPSDISIVAPYAQDAVQAIYSSGLMVGSSGKFDPYGKLSREMAATILMRIYENYFE